MVRKSRILPDVLSRWPLDNSAVRMTMHARWRPGSGGVKNLFCNDHALAKSLLAPHDKSGNSLWLQSIIAHDASRRAKNVAKARFCAKKKMVTWPRGGDNWAGQLGGNNILFHVPYRYNILFNKLFYCAYAVPYA